MKIKNILILTQNKTTERTADKCESFHPKQSGGCKIGFFNDPLFTDRKIADRSKVIQMRIAIPRLFKLSLNASELFVLHLELDLRYA